MSATTESHDEGPPKSGLHRLIGRLADSRFFTASLLLHVLIVLLVGGTVLFKVSPAAPDFEAGTEGIISDSAENTAPPDTPSAEEEHTFTPTQAEVAAPTLTALLTTSPTAAVISASPINDNSMRGISDNMKSAMDTASKRAGDAAAGAAAAAMGRAGGMKSAMIFGKKIEATKLGVILDVSGSGHPHLAGAIKEIEKGFPDAIIVLYPGCGMGDVKKKEHEIKKLSSVEKDVSATSEPYSTPGQLFKALKIEEFEKLSKKTALRDRLFVSWYDPGGKGGNLINHAQYAFEWLMDSQKADTIYWFADFQDKIDPEVSEKLLKELKRKNVKVHEHNFAGSTIRPEAMKLAQETKGTINTEKPDKPADKK